jgi:hypothetical protein
MSNRKAAVVAFVAGLGTTIAIACGPDFPWQLLSDRAATLKATPANSFSYQVTRLAGPPGDTLRAVEARAFWDNDEIVAQRASVEVKGPPGEPELIRRMREADNGGQAMEIGRALPPAIRLYTAGAVDFNADDWPSAERRFKAVLDLPESDGAARVVWAAYMLGRVARAQDDVAAAAAAFQLTRTLATGGKPDPLGLAVASFGEEAGIHLENASESYKARQWDAYTHELSRAVALYAEQAARKSESGAASLRVIVDQLLNDHDRLRIAVRAANVHRLVSAYVLWRPLDEAWTTYLPDGAVPGFSDGNDSLLAILAEAFERPGFDAASDVDNLAAVAYRTGRFELAQRFAAHGTGPMAAWVNAKLAIQRGDFPEAARFYADAVRATVAAPEELDEVNRGLLTGESGVVAMARGDYIEALNLMLPIVSRYSYWGDVAYIAERVLTVDELKDFVDAHVPATERKPKSRDYSDWYPRHGSAAADLRDLLARRLMRDRRYEEATTYFAERETGDKAVAYAQALRRAETAWRKVDRARGWYEAAVLARQDGMELMGYEAAPDFHAMAGGYDEGLGLTALGNSFVTTDERDRFATTQPPIQRFHYRYLAADLARHAADLLPPRSQSFAAVLCAATGWMLSTEGAKPRAMALYAHYVAEGALGPWGVNFGRRCPAPDFDAAASFRWTQVWRLVHAPMRRHIWALSGLVLLLGAVGAAVLYRRRSAEI